MSFRILFVDDETELLSIYVEYFQRRGYSDIATAPTAQAAIEHIEKNKPDLVFLDISLGEESLGSGMDVLERGRKAAPECKICMMSAYRDEYEDISLSMGAYAFIAKPFRPDVLLKIAEDVR